VCVFKQAYRDLSGFGNFAFVILFHFLLKQRLSHYIWLDQSKRLFHRETKKQFPHQGGSQAIKRICGFVYLQNQLMYTGKWTVGLRQAMERELQSSFFGDPGYG
jgi:hypothetical protein